MKVSICLFAATLVLGVFYTPAMANPTYGFINITNNSSTNVAGQLQMEVSDIGGNQVLFTVMNLGPEPSSITDVYFDDGTLDSLDSIDDSLPNVNFDINSTPEDLPGGNALIPPFETSEGFSVDSAPPVGPDGVNPGEWLGITFNITGTVQDVLDDLANGDLRIGLKVQALADGESDAYVNNGNGVIPAPGAVVLASIGVGMVSWLRRRRTL